jgi:serine/threonine-protein kinase
MERIQAILDSTPKLASDVVLGGPASQPSRALARAARELQGDLDNILAKAVKKAPEERYTNAVAFADDLRRYLSQEPVTARADTLTYRVGKFVRRHRAAVASVSVGVLALLSLTGVTISQLIDARRQRDEARAQTQRVQAYNTVVTSLLSQVGPGGRALTAEELLDRAVAEMQATFAEDPAFLVDMLIRISGRYLDLRNNTKELATLVRAEEVARRTADPNLIFRVQVNTVETELALGHTQQAKLRIEEARRLLPALESPPPLNAYLRAEAEVAKANGDLPAAIGYLEKARSELEKSGDTDGNTYSGLLSVLRLFYALDGNVRSAHDYAVRMVESHRLHQRERSVAGVTARAVLAVSFYDLGEVERARTLFEEAIPDVVGWTAGQSSPFVAVAWLYGEIASRSGHHDAALPLIRDSVASVVQGGNHMNMIRARLTLTRALLRAGNAVEAQQVLDEAVAGIMTDENAHRPWRIESSRLQAEVHLAQQRLDAAAADAREALERVGYPERRRGFSLPQTLLTLGRVRLAQDQPAQALEVLRDAVQLFEAGTLDPTRSADVGEALLELARAQLASGDTDAARASAARAEVSLRNGFGSATAAAP